MEVDAEHAMVPAMSDVLEKLDVRAIIMDVVACTCGWMRTNHFWY